MKLLQRRESMTTVDVEQARARVYELWDRYARTGDVERLLALYAEDAVFESPLVPIILERERGDLRGHAELRRFFEEGVRRRPNELVRWYRTGQYLHDGTTLCWEYPRAMPDGEQVDIVEMIDLDEAGRIRHHRIYWGWFGTQMLIASARRKVQSRTDG
jgi:hypothetical protein